MSENAPAPETSARMSDEVLTPAREAEIRRRIEWILDKKRHRPGHWSPEKGNLAEDAAFLLDDVKRLSDLVVPDSLRADTAEEALEQERICCNDTEHRRAAETTRAEKAEAERDAAREEIERLLKEAKLHELKIASMETEMDLLQMPASSREVEDAHAAEAAALCQIASLKALLREAPHAGNCKSDIMQFWDIESDHAFPCNCWKSKIEEALR